MFEERLREQLYDSFKNRAILYYLIFDELRSELGPKKAEELMKRATYRRGVDKAKKYAPYAPLDLSGLKKEFIGGIADQGRMFEPEITRDEHEVLDIKFHRCPLREAWQEYGLPEEEVATLCRIAARIDNGMFEAAGFKFTADTYQPGGQGCCFLHIRPGEPSKKE
jgi:hypothetical protein